METGSIAPTACIVCRNLKYTVKQPGTESGTIEFLTSYHDDVEAVHREAARGCYFCRIILAGIDSSVAPAWNASRQAKCSLTAWMKRNYAKGEWTKVLREGAYMTFRSSAGDARVEITKCLELEKGRPSQADSDRDNHTGSQESLQQAKGWLEECIRSHQGCGLKLQSLLPSRLIDVGLSTEPACPRLIMTGEKQGAYITLSHCWGSKPILTSTMATLALRMEAIPMESLPQTFIDAIIVTRAMDVRYLWIDSLCIIQDSWEDWSKESAVMGAYYENSVLTLAAADSREAQAGCFRQRNPLTVRPSVITMRLPEKGVADRQTPTGTYYNWPAEDCLVEIKPILSYEFKSQARPIDTRAWTLQEQLLSPRILYFERGRLLFTCRSAKADENSPALCTVTRSKSTKTLHPDQLHLGSNMKRDPSLSFEVLTKWYEIVQQYTLRSITKTEDVLPAISGLAARFQPLIGSEYFAGLWRSDLHQGLLWTAKTHEVSREQRFRPPSWSWASRNLNSIEFQYLDKKLDATDQCLRIENVSVHNPLQDNVSNANPYGEVDGGLLTGRGHLRLLTILVSSVSSGGRAYKHTKANLIDPRTTEKAGGILLDEERDSTDAEQDVWCVPVLQDASQRYSVCLALREESHGRFRRIGVAAISDQPWNEGAFTLSDMREICIK